MARKRLAAPAPRGTAAAPEGSPPAAPVEPPIDQGPIDTIVTEGKARVESARNDWRLGQIREAAKILIGDKGYNRMTMQELAKVAGVSIGLLYLYVESKEDVFMLVIKEIIDAYSSDVPSAASPHGDPVEALAAGFGAYCAVVERYRRQASSGYQDYKELSAESREVVRGWELETTALLKDLVEACIDQGAFVECDPDLIASDLVFLSHMWALKHWHLARSMSLDDFTAYQLGFVLHGCLHPDRRDDYGQLLAPFRRWRRRSDGQP